MTPERRAWRHMIERCTNPKHPKWRIYGGRGITVCKEWRYNFKAFLDHIGPRPSTEHSLDRYPNNDGNYEPGNVRWATHKQQQRNSRQTKFVELNGDCRAIGDWMDYFGINPNTFYSRTKSGWTIEKALMTPVSKILQVEALKELAKVIK